MARTRASTELFDRASAELRSVHQLLQGASRATDRVKGMHETAHPSTVLDAFIPRLSHFDYSGVGADLDELARETASLSFACSDLADRLMLASQNLRAAEDRIELALRSLRERVSQALCSPAFVHSVRTIASGADLFTASTIHGPLGLFWQLFRGKPGPDYTARVLARITGSSAIDPTALRVTQASAAAVSAPKSLQDMAKRIPASRAGEPQVRIERYGDSEQPTWVVYSSGTIDMSLQAPGEPWDLSSNLNAMATGTSEAILATEQAMALAGIEEQATVIHVGFSQGGLVAAHVALGHEQAQRSLLTFGAPVAHLNLEQLDHVVLVEHAEDLVPALGGEHPAKADGRVVVTAAALDQRTYDDVLPAHDMARYATTLREAEAQPNPALARAQASMLTNLVGMGVMTTWRADRGASG